MYSCFDKCLSFCLIKEGWQERFQDWQQGVVKMIGCFGTFPVILAFAGSASSLGTRGNKSRKISVFQTAFPPFLTWLFSITWRRLLRAKTCSTTSGGDTESRGTPSQGMLTGRIWQSGRSACVWRSPHMQNQPCLLLEGCWLKCDCCGPGLYSLCTYKSCYGGGVQECRLQGLHFTSISQFHIS